MKIQLKKDRLIEIAVGLVFTAVVVALYFYFHTHAHSHLFSDGRW